MTFKTVKMHANSPKNLKPNNNNNLKLTLKNVLWNLKFKITNLL